MVNGERNTEIIHSFHLLFNGVHEPYGIATPFAKPQGSQ